MERFVSGEVIVLEFPFSNLMGVKRRPALIIKVPKGDDLIVSQITGNPQEASVEIPIDKKDFQTGSLKINSYLRLDKFFSIEKSLIKYKIGSLKQEKFNEIIERICDFLKEKFDTEKIKDKITPEKLGKYFEITSKALKQVKKNIIKGKEKQAKEIIEMVENYLSDAKHFQLKKDFVNCFGAINYAHGWLDAGVRLDIFDVKDDKLFTVK